MKQFVCEVCGSTDLVKNNGAFECKFCGCKYSVEEARKMMIDVAEDAPSKAEQQTAPENYLDNSNQAEAKYNDFIKDEPERVVSSDDYEKYANNYDTKKGSSSSKSVAFGVLGILGAWIFALLGHVLSIIGIVKGVQEYKEEGKSAGLVISIIGEICAVISSLIGMSMSM